MNIDSVDIDKRGCEGVKLNKMRCKILLPEIVEQVGVKSRS